jgi:hypothetical protein
MSVIVVNFNRAGDVRLFDPSTGTMQKAVKRTWQEADGRFCEQDGSLVCLFRSRGRIHLFIDGATSIVDDALTTCLEMNGRERCFQAFRDKTLIFEKTYPRKPDTDGNPFWPSDAEDEDVFLWVHNIVGSGERQRILLTATAPR